MYNKNIDVQDVTVKPKRYQQDSVISLNEEALQNDVVTETEIPRNVTIEAAIAYFETSAVGELEVLYKRTAGWLKILLSTQNRSTTTKSREAIQDLIKKKQEGKMEDAE